MYVTFDIEDWYNFCNVPALYNSENWWNYPAQIEINTLKILQLLEDLGLKANFFVVGAHAKKRPKLIREIYDAGHAVGSHGMHHLNVKNLTNEQFKNEVTESKNLIEDILSDEVNSYRAPEFSLELSNNNFYKILSEAGYLKSSSAKVSLLSNNHGIINVLTEVGSIAEFPLPCIPVFNRLIPFSGGTYMKLIPYCALPIIKKYITTIYAHPHDFSNKTPTLCDVNRFKNYIRSRQIGTNYSKKMKYILKEIKSSDLI